MRYFNTAGPCKPDIHYMVPPLDRLPPLRRLIDQQAYFVLHAPRQVGKTTTMLELARQLTAEGRYAAVLLSVEVADPFRNDPDRAERSILGTWRSALMARLPVELRPTIPEDAEAGSRLRATLQVWAQNSPRPVVLFIDEIDTLQDEALISVLRQIRDGYADRPHAFPWSLALIGMRDVRDYKFASGGSDRLNTASPFNIKMESLTMGDFSADEVAALYRQHTAETGQVFTDEAVALAFDLTQGQPWLVNALARQATEFLQPDPAKPITPEVIAAAKQILIQRKDTHLDSLAKRLEEPRIRNVIEPMLAGADVALTGVSFDDLEFVRDLGLVRDDGFGNLVIANPIYREIIPDELTTVTRAAITLTRPTWLKADGTLDPERLLEGFLAFWRQHGEPLMRNVTYPEVAPHIVAMAYLHRVVNGGGTIEREYAIGMGRMDLCLRYGAVTLGIELKVWRDGRPDPVVEGVEQIDRYLAGLGQETGWLMIFDRRTGRSDLAERVRTESATTTGGRTITVIRA